VPGRRLTLAALIALIDFVAPVLLVWLAEPGLNWSGWPLAVGAAIVVPPFVFQLLSRPQPGWGHGLAFAVVPALVLAGVAGILFPRDREYPGGAGWIVFAVVFAFISFFIAGMVGPSLASLVARPWERENPVHRPQRLRAWHVGAVVATLDVLAVAVVAAAGL